MVRVTLTDSKGGPVASVSLDTPHIAVVMYQGRAYLLWSASHNGSIAVYRETSVAVID